MAHDLRQELQGKMAKPWSKTLRDEKRKQRKKEPHEKRPKEYKKGKKMGAFGTSYLKPYGE